MSVNKIVLFLVKIILNLRVYGNI